jgi:hypothetical protein
MTSRPALGLAQPSIQWVPRAFSPGVKRQGREADHSPPGSVEVKKLHLYHIKCYFKRTMTMTKI